METFDTSSLNRTTSALADVVVVGVDEDRRLRPTAAPARSAATAATATTTNSLRFTTSPAADIEERARPKPGSLSDDQRSQGRLPFTFRRPGSLGAAGSAAGGGAAGADDWNRGGGEYWTSPLGSGAAGASEPSRLRGRTPGVPATSYWRGES